MQAGTERVAPSTGRPRVARLPSGSAVLTAAVLVAALVVTAAVFPLTAVRFVLLILVFVPLERVLGSRPLPVLRRGFGTDVIYFFANQLVALVSILGIATAIAWVFEQIGPATRDAVGAQPFLLQFLEALTISSVAFYWAHRMLHSVPPLWRFHAVHHAIEDLDWLGASRQHPVEIIVVNVATLVPLAALGFSWATLGSYALFAAFWTHFDHANLRVRVPVLRWVISTPEWHRWHHATDGDAVEHNFSGFPIIDRVFGTAFLPDRRQPRAFGTREPIPQEGYVAQIAHPFRRIEPDPAPA